jgi:phenylacetate-coenzyme A ligase PaaK-like adenylate-forming protein
LNPPSTNDIFSIQSEQDFEKLALQTFYFQAKNNKVYADFLANLKVEPLSITKIEDIVFLPISAFKHHKVLSVLDEPEATFTSSGTTQTGNSSHLVTDLSVYETSFLKCFELFFGSPQNYCFIFLLPSYMERSGSSLIYMCNKLAEKSNDPEAGFFLKDTEKLLEILKNGPKSERKVFLIGVSFALLDLAALSPSVQPETIIMETGGMKGRKKEITRSELHGILKKGLGTEKIYSEYGMTELLSQAYSLGDERFSPPPWMRFSIYDPNDPLSKAPQGSTGGINIIDLANRNSCAFISTQDLGRMHPNHSLEILGRFDFSEVRGCNLMVS